MKDYDLDGFDGLVKRSRARSTKTLVGLYQSNRAGIESDPATPWATVCEDHDSVVCHYSLADARSFMAHPETWCDECRAEVEQREENGDPTMKFRMNVDMGGDAFEDDPGELARILRRLADMVDHRDSSGTIVDNNGNTVGRWEING